MNYYVSLITHVVDYVDANITRPLPLDDLSREFGFSAFHFNRIFRTVSGLTLKQYILGRKLSLAMNRLETGGEPVIDIVINYGFHSPEVFSRAFKKQFGISPDGFRKSRPALPAVNRPVIVERDIVNIQGNLALKGDVVSLEETRLTGTQMTVNANSPTFEGSLRSASDDFYSKATQAGQAALEPYYALVNCLGDEDDGQYRVFFGFENLTSTASPVTRTIPAGPYARFLYTGDMFDIRLSFINDLYRWVIVKEIKLEKTGIGMLNIFMADYPETKAVQILVPIKQG